MARTSVDAIANLRPVIILDFDAIVRMIAAAMFKADVIVADAILVSDKNEPSVRCPLKLSSQTRMSVEFVIGLPSIDEPGRHIWLMVGYAPSHFPAKSHQEPSTDVLPVEVTPDG